MKLETLQKTIQKLEADLFMERDEYSVMKNTVGLHEEVIRNLTNAKLQISDQLKLEKKRIIEIQDSIKQLK